MGVQLLSLDENLRFAAEARLATLGGVLCAAVVALVTVGLPRLLAAGASPGRALRSEVPA